jgi:hypothetical protein
MYWRCYLWPKDVFPVYHFTDLTPELDQHQLDHHRPPETLHELHLHHHHQIRRRSVVAENVAAHFRNFHDQGVSSGKPRHLRGHRRQAEQNYIQVKKK